MVYYEDDPASSQIRAVLPAQGIFLSFVGSCFRAYELQSRGLNDMYEAQVPVPFGFLVFFVTRHVLFFLFRPLCILPRIAMQRPALSSGCGQALTSFAANVAVS